jgi:hypothetical protein
MDIQMSRSDMKIFVVACLAALPLLCVAAGDKPARNAAAAASAPAVSRAASQPAPTKAARHKNAAVPGASAASAAAAPPKAATAQVKVDRLQGAGLGGVSTPPKRPPRTDELAVGAPERQPPPAIVKR